MASPEDKDRYRRRIRSRLKCDLRSPLYRQRVKEGKKKTLVIKDLTHTDLVRLIQEQEQDD